MSQGRTRLDDGDRRGPHNNNTLGVDVLILTLAALLGDGNRLTPGVVVTGFW